MTKAFVIIFFTFTTLIVSQNIVSQNKSSLIKLKTEMHESGVINFDEAGTKGTFVKKNVGLGILYSMLLPGMGELYGGDYTTGKYFTIFEAVSWLTYIGVDYYSTMKRNDYHDYAVAHAGVNPAGKNDKYWGNIGIYMNIDRYNGTMDLQWNFDEVYNRDAFYWKWKTNSERKTYRDMWTSSAQAKTSLNYIAGVMVLNRIVSAINAVRVIKLHNKHLTSANTFQINFSVNSFAGISDGLRLNFLKRF